MPAKVFYRTTINKMHGKYFAMFILHRSLNWINSHVFQHRTNMRRSTTLALQLTKSLIRLTGNAPIFASEPIPKHVWFISCPSWSVTEGLRLSLARRIRFWKHYTRKMRSAMVWIYSQSSYVLRQVSLYENDDSDIGCSFKRFSIKLRKKCKKK